MELINNLITQIKLLFNPEMLVKFVRIPKRIEDVKHYQIRDGFR